MLIYQLAPLFGEELQAAGFHRIRLQGAEPIGVAAPGVAGACDLAALWEARQGSLEPLPDCRGFVATSDANVDIYSKAFFALRQPAHVPYEVSLTWRRLGPEVQKPLELWMSGVALLLSEERYGFWSIRSTGLLN